MLRRMGIMRSMGSKLNVFTSTSASKFNHSLSRLVLNFAKNTTRTLGMGILSDKERKVSGILVMPYLGRFQKVVVKCFILRLEMKVGLKRVQ